jgi:hypothetical protein
MPTTTVRSPDGELIKVSHPEGASEAEIIAFARAQAAPALSAERVPSNPFYERARETFEGVLRGAAGIGNTLLTPVRKAASAVGADTVADYLNSSLDAQKSLDAQNADSNFYGGAKLATEIGMTYPVGGALAAPLRAVSGVAPRMLAPLAEAVATSGMKAGGATGLPGLTARMAGGAITGGASAGLVDPSQAGTGAMIGGALPAAVKGAGWAGSKVGGDVLRPSAANAPLADKAMNQYGIPLSVADVSSSALVKGARSALDDVPLIGNRGRAQKEAVQAAFNREVGKTFGETADSLTPQVLDSARSRMGAEFDRIWNRNALQFDGNLFTQLQGLRANAAKLPQGEQGRLASWLDDFEAKLVADANGNLYMPGDVANRFQSTLRREADKANGFLKDDLINLRQSVVKAFNRSVSPQDAAALTMNRGQYKAFKTVEPLLQSAEAGVAGRAVGDVPAALLPQAVRKSYSSGIASSPFADLSQIGSQYVADRVARTGGSARAMFQNSALGSGLALGAWQNPLVPLTAIPAAYGLEGLLSSPAVARRMLTRTNGLLEIPGLARPVPVIAADQ